MKENLKDYVVIDIDKYNNLQSKNIYLREENKRLSSKMKVFENYFIEGILSKLKYELNNIEEYSLDDYYVRKIICDFLEYGNFEYKYMVDKIKEYKESMKEDDKE
ncbi:MAG: hypothetical protein IKF36_06890 [Bacilli bacterium]|nr:hypothetical protein [Bacilli bacterium]